MSKMNKRSAGVSSSVQALEDELTGQIVDQAAEIETGRRNVRENTEWQRSAMVHNRHFGQHIGRRRRHPLRTLHQHDAFWATTDSTETKWEEALMQDHEREMIPEVYKSNPELGLLTNQIGLVATANRNFQLSKNKLQNTNLVGV